MIGEFVGGFSITYQQSLLHVLVLFRLRRKFRSKEAQASGEWRKTAERTTYLVPPPMSVIHSRTS